MVSHRVLLPVFLTFDLNWNKQLDSSSISPRRLRDIYLPAHFSTSATLVK